jgi:hypothetical protein
MVKGEVPYKLVRRVFKEYVKGEVSSKAIINAKEFIDNVLIELAKASNEELQSENRLRQIQGLPKYKRLTEPILIKVLNRVFKSNIGSNSGETGQHNSDTVLHTDAKQIGNYYA